MKIIDVFAKKFLLNNHNFQRFRRFPKGANNNRQNNKYNSLTSRCVDM